MKAVIIGGGIAGLSLGIFLNKKNIEVVVSERGDGTLEKGHAFLMHNDGFTILRELNKGKAIDFLGKNANTFSLYNSRGEKIKHQFLNFWKCIKRNDLIQFLESLYPIAQLRYNRKFSHFLYENEMPVAAVFLNGDVEYGDIFIGADGGYSKVREAIFGKTDFNPINVKEIIGISHHSNICENNSGTFNKYHDEANSIAFGFIPTSKDELVWFMQYDPAKSDIINETPEAIKAFCLNSIKEFPAITREIIEANDFTKSYIWNTRDFDLLPKFHHQNVVLIGDAAHLSLPFTSAGTTNAIIDAKTLVEKLMESPDYETAFNHFYKERSGEVLNHIQMGRDLQYMFLHPQTNKESERTVPLIKGKSRIFENDKDAPIKVLYFTDPICSTCWIKQPTLRKLKLEYGKYLNIEYKMGGLLPCWEAYKTKKGKIQSPADAANHWEEVCSIYKMPMDGDIWIEDPLPSSYPPSIAFKAAQMQDPDLAILFLRRISEMVFVEKKNINKWEYIEVAAFESGLDTIKLLRDYEGKAHELFKDDILLSHKLEVFSMPTFIFTDNANHTHKITGYQPYEKYEEIIKLMYPGAKKTNINLTPEDQFSSFKTMTNKEFAFINDISKEKAGEILMGLCTNGIIDKHNSKNGVMWKNKHEFSMHD